MIQSPLSCLSNGLLNPLENRLCTRTLHCGVFVPGVTFLLCPHPDQDQLPFLSSHNDSVEMICHMIAAKSSFGEEITAGVCL